MPVTRSTNQQARTHRLQSITPPLPRSQSRNAPATQHSTDIISLTPSDAESTVPFKKAFKKKNEKPRSRPLPIDIIEISSDDDSPPPRPKQTAVHSTAVPPPEPAAIADFRRQISQYRGVCLSFNIFMVRLTSSIRLCFQEAAKSKKDLEKVSKEVAELREENNELQRLRNAGNGKITLVS